MSLTLDPGSTSANLLVAWTHADLEQSIPQRFARMVDRYPDHIAIKSRTCTWTYAQLNRHAQSIASVILRERGAGLEPIGLWFNQGPGVNAAALGALMARKIYVPLDMAHPAAVLSQILSDADIALILTDKDHFDAARALAESKHIPVIDVASSTLADASSESQFLHSNYHDPAYIYYTSGSTGKPKGVVDSHRNVLHNVLRYTNQLHIHADDRLTLLQAPAFSGAVSSLFCALLNGATSFPVDVRAEHPDRLAEWLLHQRVTMIHCVPALFRALMREGRMFPDVRVVRLEGDQASRRDLELFRAHFSSDCILANGLGATEMGLARQFFMDRTTEVDGAFLPVGYPVPDMRTVILDEDGNDAGLERIGEITVESGYLALGYWKNPEATKKQFPRGKDGKRMYRTGDLGRLRADGCLESLGRKDLRVKIRGQFVEPAEIENALLSQPTVNDAAVVARLNRWGENELVAFVVTSESTSAVRSQLATRVPQGMLPAKFIRLDALPLNGNGKLDRSALQTTGIEQKDFVPPQNEIQTKLTEIWAEVLGLERVSVEAPFLELGGESLRAFRILARLYDTFHVDLTLQEFFGASTIAEQAQLLESRILRDEGSSC